MICPKCNQPEAHRSHSAGMADQMAAIFSRTPYRCKACKKRYYVYKHGEKSSRMRTAEERRIMRIRRKYKWKQSRRQLFAFAFVAIILVAVLFFAMQQRITSE